MARERKRHASGWCRLAPAWIMVLYSIVTAPRLTLVVLCLALPTAGWRFEARAAWQNPELQAGRTVQGKIADDRSRHFEIRVDSGDYVQVQIDHWGPDIVVRVSGPSRQIVEREYRQSRPTSLSMIAPVSGTYDLEIGSLRKPSDPIRFELALSTPRTPVSEDQSRIEAEKAYSEADNLRAKWRVEFNRRVIEGLEKALERWSEAGELRNVVHTLNLLGEVYHGMGKPQRALEYCEGALRTSEKAGDLVGMVESINNLSSLYVQLGENDEALTLSLRASNISQDIGDRRAEAQALNGLGWVYYHLGRSQEALDYYRRALETWRILGDQRGQAQALLNSGFVYLWSDKSKAMGAYNEALALWSTVDDRRGQAITLTSLGHLYSTTGEKQKALNLYLEARPLFERIGDPYWEAGLVAGLGYVYVQLGEEDKALGYYAEALRLNRAVSDHGGVAATLLDIARIYSSLGQNKKALDHCERALSTFTSLNNKRWQSVALEDIGKTYESMGARKQALEYYNKALLLSREVGYKREQAYALNKIGSVHYAAGEIQKALECYKEALTLTRALNDRFNESLVLYNMARISRDLEDTGDANALVESSLAIVESLRAEVASHELRASYVASIYQYYELHVQLLMQMHKQHPSGNHDSNALLAFEKARARSFLDALAEGRSEIRRGIETALLEKERSLQQQLNAKAERQIQLLSSGGDEAESAAIEKEIQALTTEFEQLQALIRSKSPRYAALTQPQPLSLEEIQREVLDDDTLLLEYALGEERSFLWAVTNKSHTSHELPPRIEVDEAARLVYELLTARQPLPGDDVRSHRTRVKEADSRYWQEAARLSEMVLGPVASQLGSKRLLVVSDGALQYIPFGALPVPGSAEAGHEAVPLVLEHEMVSMPSASTLAVLRNETEGRKAASKFVAVLADPVFDVEDARLMGEGAVGQKATGKDPDGTVHDPPVVSDLHRALRDVGFLKEGRLYIPRLPSTRREAAAIIAAAPPGAGFQAIDFRASRETATDPTLADYRIVHFATHGLLNNEHPELSGIILSMVDEKGEAQNGFLRLHDIYNLDLPVDLVVLSACNSGLGKNVRGEGLVGMVRGFMYAGAERVVASLWKVDDEATGELMKAFYREMLEEGSTPAAALRKAQIAMWRQNQWQSPFYWAAFVLQGEWM